MAIGSSPLYNMTQYVQEHTLLNRGMIDIGGCAVPHAIKSNNKTEACERLGMASLYFSLAILTPYIFLPIFNKRALLKHGIVKDLKSQEKKIIQVSKEFLNKDSNKMIKGIKAKGKQLGCEKDFDNILDRFKDKESLRQKLIKAHGNILTKDYLSTAWMWCATPYVVTEITERTTNRKGYSGSIGMKKDVQLSDKDYQKQKHKKMIASALLATVPSLLVPRMVTKAIKNPNHINKFMKTLNKKANLFDYGFEINMSKTIFATVWGTTSLPSKIIAARDKDERRDRALRESALFGMYFTGDFLLNNVLGRVSDKIFNTKIIDTDKANGKKLNFFQKFKLPLRNFREVEEKLVGETPKMINRTKNIGAGIYWASLLGNMALIGFGLPTVLNKILKSSIAKEAQNKKIENKFELHNATFDKIKSNKNIRAIAK